MKDLIAFFGEFIVVISVAGIFHAMSPEGAQKKYIHFVISLCVLTSLVGPMLSVVSSLPEFLEDVELGLEENQFDMDALLDDAVVSASKENIENAISSMISQKFGISTENITVSIFLDAEDLSNIQILSVNVRVEDATYVKRAEIEKYLLDMLMDHCEVNVSG
jgi:hypothetical protein